MFFLLVCCFLVGAKAYIETPRVSDVTEWKWQDLEDGACKTDLIDYITTLSNLGGDNGWALQMLDSSAKIPNGLLAFNLIHIGMYDECLAIVHPSGRFQGKHCMISIGVVPSTQTAPELPKFLEIYQPKPEKPEHKKTRDIDYVLSLGYGICLPSSCMAKDINTILGNNKRITANDNNCSIIEDKEFSDLAIAFIAVSAVLGFLTVASTCYHSYSIYRNEKPKRLLCAFSLRENIPKLLEIRSNDGDNMGCLHGIRTMSMMWVLLGHTYSILLTAPILNFAEVGLLRQRADHLLLTNAYFSVDSFFFLSGLLVAFVFFRNIGKTGTYDVISSYIHRYIRLTPPLAMMMFAVVSIMPFTGSGPLWYDAMEGQAASCRENWWSTILYVQNYVKPEGSCLGQSWYLSADMQMFWIGPIVMYPILLWPKIGVVFLGLVTVAATIWTAVLANENQLQASVLLMKDMTQWSLDYVPTHTRIIPWLVGVACSVLICGIKAKKIQIRLPMYIVILGWLISATLCLAIIFSIHEFQINPEPSFVDSALYLSLTRLGWGLGLSWVVFACIFGYGGIINTFLSMGIWQPLGKLSYSVFLVHVTMLTYKSASLKSNIVLDDLTGVSEFFTALVFSYLISLVLYATVEAPFMIMDQEILGSVRILPFPKPKRKNNEMREEEMERGVSPSDLSDRKI